MVETYDAGSLPFVGNYETFMKEAKNYTSKEKDHEYFEKIIVESFKDKIDAGIDIPNYPQFRDMNDMFFELISNLEKIEGKYYFTRTPDVVGGGRIPEVEALRKNAHRLAELRGRVRMKICVTGPYTLSYFFGFRDCELFKNLANVLAKIVAANTFKEKNLVVDVVSLDEPLIGTLDDPLIDHGSEGRECLIKSLDKIFYEAKSRGARTVIHLHSTTSKLFWLVENLDVIESHVGDIIYSSLSTRRLLENYDKFLKASICRTDYDRLVYEKTKDLGEERVLEEIDKIWKKIKSGEIDPTYYLEDLEVLKLRLENIIKAFGERVLYAGPECGMKGFPSYECAIECLKRVAKASKIV